MKNFILGCLFILLTAAGTVSIMTVKPAKPKSVLIKSFTYQGDSDNVAEYVRQKIRSGYILKSVDGANDGQYNSTWIVVMEKY